MTNVGFLNTRVIFMNKLVGFFLCSLTMLGGLILFSTGCGQAAGENAPSASGRLTVVCTVGMVADVVRQVAQDRVSVIQLMDAGIDPHGYKPTRDDMLRLQKADVIFYSGLMLEGKMASALETLSKTQKVYPVTHAIPKEQLIFPSTEHHEADPHVWMDASLWAETAYFIAERLSELDPPYAQRYRQNADTYAHTCRTFHAWARQVMQTIPQDRRVLITSHDAFNYFGRAYGVEVKGVQGISTESEANIRDINHLVDLLVSRKIQAVFVESSVAPKNLQAVIEGARARGHTVTIGGQLFSDAMGPSQTYEGTYLGMMDHNVTTIAKALGGTVPDRGWQGRLTLQP